MNRSTKKFFLLFAFAAIITTSSPLQAAWWNPLTWFGQDDKNAITPTKQAITITIQHKDRISGYIIVDNNIRYLSYIQDEIYKKTKIKPFAQKITINNEEIKKLEDIIRAADNFGSVTITVTQILQSKDGPIEGKEFSDIGEKITSIEPEENNKPQRSDDEKEEEKAVSDQIAITVNRMTKENAISKTEIRVQSNISFEDFQNAVTDKTGHEQKKQKFVFSGKKIDTEKEFRDFMEKIAQQEEKEIFLVNKSVEKAQPAQEMKKREKKEEAGNPLAKLQGLDSGLDPSKPIYLKQDTKKDKIIREEKTIPQSEKITAAQIIAPMETKPAAPAFQAVVTIPKKSIKETKSEDIFKERQGLSTKNNE